MNFEDHFNDLFLPEDNEAAKLAFRNLVTSLKLSNEYVKNDDDEGLNIVHRNLSNALADLNRLAIRKENSHHIYLHHLLTKPQGWFPV